jgi:hypothetical protein
MRLIAGEVGAWAAARHVSSLEIASTSETIQLRQHLFGHRCERAALRKASAIVNQHGKHRGLAVHRFADTHLHTLVVCDRVQAGKFALYTEAGLRKRLHIRVPFERCRIRPIGSERYLGNTVRYFFKQEEHHGTAFDLAHDGAACPTSSACAWATRGSPSE